ncbi:hypothetical protein D3C84_1311620 [compost metagenome]
MDIDMILMNYESIEIAKRLYLTCGAPQMRANKQWINSQHFPPEQYYPDKSPRIFNNIKSFLQAV